MSESLRLEVLHVEIFLKSPKLKSKPNKIKEVHGTLKVMNMSIVNIFPQIVFFWNNRVFAFSCP